jgi:hypothetical protein
LYATLCQAQVDSPNGNFNATGTSNLSLQTNSIPRLSILGSAAGTGFVGINTTTPIDYLLVNGNVRGNQFNVIGGILNVSSANNFSLQLNNVPRLSVLSTNGFVGIGKDNPSFMLDVNGAVNASNLFLNGNLGIGTTSPSHKLHVSGGDVLIDGGNLLLNSTSPSVYLGNTSTNLNRYLLVVNSPQLQAPSGVKAGGVLVADAYNYASPSKNDLVVKGHVGIGTTLATNPNNYALAVNGIIGAKDLRVEKSSATWPDYVFNDDYDLPSVKELESYIKENKHLMGVPSAKEVEENGYSMNGMDVILLQKLEELTLLVIQQQKEINALRELVQE